MTQVFMWVALGAAAGSGPEPADPALLARVRAYERARIEVVDRAMPTVVCMFPKGNRSGGGSGVIIDPEGYGLTNFHVVAAMLKDRVGEGGLSDHRLYPFEVLGIDPTGDIAMFKLSRSEPFPFAPLGDSDGLRVGDSALAMGNPFLLAEDYTPTVTLGIVSGLHRYQWGSGRALRYTDCIQVDTSINPGNSGGPLFDLAGRVVGINGRVSIEERGRVNVGVGYAVTINQIRRFLPSLRAGLATPHATAGFTVRDRGRRVVIDQILDSSPAYRAGLRLGDEIATFGGARIRTANRFVSVLGVYPGGWPVEVAFRRTRETPPRRNVEASRPRAGKGDEPDAGDEMEIHVAVFRLEKLPFPKAKAPAAAKGAIDPLASHPVTRAANRRAVRRAWAMYRRAIGRDEALRAVRSIHVRGERVRAGGAATEPEPLEETDVRPESAGDRAAARPAVGSPDEGVSHDAARAAALERTIRWGLLDAGADPIAAGWAVVGGDEVRGRVAVVIERSVDGGGRWRVCFDDADGRLLRVAFGDPASGRRVRYEYDDYRRAGPVKLPHRRWLYFDGALYAEDRFEEVRVSSGTS